MAVFKWRVSSNGYCWRRRSPRSRRPRVLSTNGIRQFRDYPTMTECPNLFLRFAYLKTDAESILEFANRYGPLTAGVQVFDEHGCPVGVREREQYVWPNGLPPEDYASWWVTRKEWALTPETLWDWVSEVENMRELIRDWENATRLNSPEARQNVHRRIGAQLRYLVLAGYDETGVLSLQPINLIAALWLQFATSVSVGRVQRQCPRCRDWFEVGAAYANSQGKRRTRTDKRYCKESCRTGAAYDRRSKGTDALADDQ